MIYRFALGQVEFTSNVLLNNCKQNITSLSLLVGTTVPCNSNVHLQQQMLLNFEIYTKQVSCPLALFFYYLKLPISFKIPVTIRQIVYIYMTAISPNLIS